MRKTIPVLAIGLVVLVSVAPVALLLVLTWDTIVLSWRFVAWAVLYTLFVVGVVSAALHASNPARTRPASLDRPHWRTSHRAVAPNGSLIAEIAHAMEHSMSNPTVGTLRITDGLELQKCSPAFLWSDDSRYLAVPQWHWRFVSGLRQRLVIVDVEYRTVYTSRFTGCLLLPKTFDQGKLEVLISQSFGFTFGWKKKPLIVEVPQGLQEFVKSGYK
jgi:hypothetical protein